MADPREDQDWIDDQMYLDDDEDDDIDMLEADCGLMADGNCGNAGTEWCDWMCPLNGDRNANRITTRLEGRHAPTHWQPLPTPPKAKTP